MSDDDEIVRLCAAAPQHSFAIDPTWGTITFSPCGVASSNKNDLEQRYCARCHRFIADVMRFERMQRQPKTDAYGEIINGSETYICIAERLRSEQSVVIGWTDGLGSHRDIIFTLSPQVFGMIQGIHPAAQTQHPNHLLFVSVMRGGSFAFDTRSDRTSPLQADYIKEKLMVGGATAERIADLVNGVIGALRPTTAEAAE